MTESCKMPSEVTVPSLAHALNRKGVHVLFPSDMDANVMVGAGATTLSRVGGMRQGSRAALQTTTLQRGKLETSFCLPKPLYFGVS